MPNILIEAMSSGLPIVCSSFPPMPEFLKEFGIYFDPENVESLQNSIFFIISCYEKIKKINIQSNQCKYHKNFHLHLI